MKLYNGYNGDTFVPPNSGWTTGWSSTGGVFAPKAYFSELPLVGMFPGSFLRSKIWKEKKKKVKIKGISRKVNSTPRGMELENSVKGLGYHVRLSINRV